MREISLILAATALIYAGVGGWIATLTHGSATKQYTLHHGSSIASAHDETALRASP